ncbi:MAG: [Fe-Fe] hydrogenase large subunit C-terminal domain-containing protein [Candidatus Diapherotrites archaeon]
MGFNAILKEQEIGNKILIAQVAPSIRVSIGEEFGMATGTIVTKKLVGALKKAGFHYVFDTATSADIVTLEETQEFIERKKNGGRLPIFTSCCPGFVSYIEHAHPEYVDNLCSCKSPQEVMGALIKTYFAERKNIDPKNIFVVSIMPCMIKKAEARRPELRFDRIPHVDKVLTTVECANFLKEKGIDLKKAEEKDFDSLLGKSTGAGNIFGATGGVMESVLRLYSSMKDKKMGKIEFKEVRGMDGVKEATVKIGNEKIKVAVINGLKNAAQILNDSEKLKEFAIIECMACAGGCVGGAGQPKTTIDKVDLRRKALYKVDSEKKERTSSENTAVKKLYSDYLEKPGSEKAKKLLHTKYLTFYEN